MALKHTFVALKNICSIWASSISQNLPTVYGTADLDDHYIFQRFNIIRSITYLGNHICNN